MFSVCSVLRQSRNVGNPSKPLVIRPLRAFAEASGTQYGTQEGSIQLLVHLTRLNTTVGVYVLLQYIGTLVAVQNNWLPEACRATDPLWQLAGFDSIIRCQK